MRVLHVDGTTASCREPDGALAEVDVALVDVVPGDAVLVHACVAIQRIEVTA
jgi:hydrogenase maturation factor